MMTVDRVADLIYGLKRVEYIQILKLWAEEIIDECAEQAECSYEGDDSYGELTGIDKESILKLKQQL